jgi:hypothetical protein
MQPLGSNCVILSIKFDPEVAAAKDSRSYQHRAGTAERTKHDVSRLREGFDEQFELCRRFRDGMELVAGVRQEPALPWRSGLSFD